MKYFVISDPHGFYTKTRQALKDAGFFDEGEDGKLVLLGDLLDRGDEPCEMVEFMYMLKRQGRLIYITGNHEWLLVKMLGELAKGDISMHHIINGTWDTAKRLSGMPDGMAESYPDEVIRGVRKSRFYTELLPFGVNYFETKNYIFTHGYIPCDKVRQEDGIRYYYRDDWRDADALDWQSASWLNGMEMALDHGVKEEGKTIVVGHVRASYGHSKYSGICTERGEDAIYTPFYDDGIIAVDGCTVRSGVVNCVVIQDEPLE